MLQGYGFKWEFVAGHFICKVFEDSVIISVLSLNGTS